MISKIYQFLEELEPLLRDVKEPTAISSRKSMVLLGWMRFQPNIAPAREFVFEKHFRYAWGLEKGKSTPIEEGWRELLSSYGFRGVDAVDKALMTSLDRGLIDKGALQKLLSEADDALERSGAHSPLSLAWDFFRESFGDNEEDVVSRLLNGVQETKFLSVGNLGATYNLISKLGREEDAKVMVDEFIAKKKVPDSFWNLSEHPFENDHLPSYIVNSFDTKDKEINKPPEVKQLLLSLGSGEGYNREDVAYLVSRSDESLLEILLNSQGDDLRRIVNGGMRFRRLGDQGAEDEQQLARKMLRVLKIIAERSRIDLLRVKNLTGIAFENELPD